MDDIWTTIKLTSGDLTLVLLPGIGGRLWDVVFEGRSLLFQNPDLQGRAPDLASLTELPTRSPQFGFPLWGGEKTWIAPDKAWVGGGPYPVLDSAPYQVVAQDAGQITMRSAICPISQLQIERRISVEGGSSWSIHHRITNRGATARPAGVWSVLMLDRPARVGLLAEAPQAATVFGDPTGHFECRPGAVICDCTDAAEFKIGTGNPSGRVFLNLSDGHAEHWLCCRTAPPGPGDVFAHGHNLEIFNSGDYAYCEAEWHGPAHRLEPNGQAEFAQDFTLWSGRKPPPSLAITSAEEDLLKCMS